MKLRFGACLLVMAMLFTIACDDEARYTVVNQTNETLRTGWFGRECSFETEAGLRPSTLLEDIVLPGQSLEAFHLVAGASASPGCVVVMNEDQSRILLFPYREDDTYVIQAGDLVAASVPLPPNSSGDSWARWRPIIGGVLTLVIVSIPGLAVAAWANRRSLRTRFSKTRDANR